jgi:hypothetical protein
LTEPRKIIIPEGAMNQSTNALTLTGIAGAVALAGASQAYGAIVNLTDPTNITGKAPSTAASSKEYYTILTGKTSTKSSTGAQLEFGYLNSSTYNEFFTGVYGLTAGTQAAGYYSSAGTVYSYPLPKGATIGTGGSYAFNQHTGYFTIMAIDDGGTQYGFMTENEDVYLGFQFLDTADGLIHDGWLELDSETYTSSTSPGGLIFLGGAYNDVADVNGGTITAGQTASVPEPGTLSALAAGAVALAGVGLKRRRQNAVLVAGLN